MMPALQTLRRPAESSVKAKQWWNYLPEVSREAQEWCSAYEQFGAEISKRTTITVQDLQNRRLERAWNSLEECRIYIEDIKRVAPRSVFTVIEISYFSTLAYYHYHAAAFNTAREVLSRATSLIEETIGLASFLVPCAGQCYDYRLHLARIARAEACWEEMFKQIQVGRDMVYGKIPLCNTAHGPVYLQDVCMFYQKRTSLNEFEREALSLQSNPETIQHEYHNLCVSATIVPFIVVNWLGY